MLSSIFTTLTGLLAVATALPASLDPTTGAELAITKPRVPIDFRNIEKPYQPQLKRQEPPACGPQNQLVKGDPDEGRGVRVTNKEGAPRTYFFYQNSCDEQPMYYLQLAANQTEFVALPELFQGRIVRGKEDVMLDGKPHLLGTWVEITFDEYGKGSGDVSLIRGCDGAAEIQALDDAGLKQGFSDDVLTGAPEEALERKDSGVMALGPTEDGVGNPFGAQHTWLKSLLGGLLHLKAYIDDELTSMPYPVIQSSNERFHVTFYPGRP